MLRMWCLSVMRILKIVYEAICCVRIVRLQKLWGRCWLRQQLMNTFQYRSHSHRREALATSAPETHPAFFFTSSFYLIDRIWWYVLWLRLNLSQKRRVVVNGGNFEWVSLWVKKGLAYYEVKTCSSRYKPTSLLMQLATWRYEFWLTSLIGPELIGICG